MNNKQRYLKDDGQLSRSGKTIVRTSKSGRKYYHNPTKYKEIKEELNKKLTEEGKILRGEYDNQRVKPLCTDKKSPAYMRYFETKSKIRGEYPTWVRMSREQHREYFSRVLELMQGEDYKEWRWESRTFREREKDEWWEEKNEKDKRYNGHSDEYSW
jgi:hypothetical protein